MGDPAEGQQRIRSGNGRRAGRLYAATRSRLSAGLSGRDLKATPCRNARADPDESGTPGPFRLRVRTQRDRQPLHDVCSARRLAPCQGHRSPYRRGVRSCLERAGRSSTSQTPRPSSSSRTISTSMPRRHSTKPFLPPKPGAWSSASNGTTPQSTAAGSTWRSPNSASYRPSASTAASPTSKPSSKKSPLGSMTAMPTTPSPTGTSPPPTHASNSNTYTPQSD